MSTILHETTTTTCQPWCTDHDWDDSPETGGVCVSPARGGKAGAWLMQGRTDASPLMHIDVPTRDDLTLDQARDLADAITALGFAARQGWPVDAPKDLVEGVDGIVRVVRK